jgi:apolipoprotein N-acyltransferase
MVISKRNRFLLSILSGMLMVFSFPFTGSIPFLGFISWIPLLLVENTILTRNYKSGKVFIHAYLVFLIYNVGTTWWIYFASPGGAYFAYLLNSLLMSIAFYFYHLTRKRLNRKFSLVYLLIIWIGFEHVHYHWELSWPWLTLGNIFSRNPELIQWYEFTGVMGGSIWLLIVNYFIYSLINRWQIGGKIAVNKELTLILAILSLIAIPIVSSWIIYSRYTEQSNPVEVVVVQPNIDPYNEKFVSNVEEQVQSMLTVAESKVTSKTKFVLFPETAISSSFDERKIDQISSIKTIRQFIKEHPGIYVYTGASTYAFFKEMNSIASRKIPEIDEYIEFYNTSIGIDTMNSQIIHKSKLVLGVEKIPFSEWLPFLEELSINNGGTSGTLGKEKEPRTISAYSLKFAPVVCYESIYGEFIGNQVRNGAELVFIITNDGWWKDTPGYKQHNSFASLRAIETRRSVARSANTGISSFVNQRGDVLQVSKWWQEAGLVSTLNRNSKQTLYTSYGDILYRFCSYFALFLVSTSVLVIPIYTLLRTKKESPK